MKPGCRVRVFGLIKSKQYNGYEGILLKKLDDGRWSVKLDIKKKKKKLSLKTENLTLADNDTEKKEDVALLRRIVETVRSIDPREVLLDGVFKRMLDPSSFRKSVFPFAESSNDIPESLLELVVDEKYRNMLIHIMPRVRKKAESVVEGANRRARESGDLGSVMPSPMVWHVTLEGFARELIGSIKEYAAQVMRVHQSLASPDNEKYTNCVQFDEETLSCLQRDGFAFQDNFFGM
jgi:hypothetical protein